MTLFKKPRLYLPQNPSRDIDANLNIFSSCRRLLKPKNRTKSIVINTIDPDNLVLATIQPDNNLNIKNPPIQKTSIAGIFFKNNEYTKLKVKYPIIIHPNFRLNEKEKITDTIPKIQAAIAALLMLSLPEAIGFNDFSGCIRSRLISMISFSKYTVLAAAEKIKNTITISRLKGRLKRLPPKINGKTMKKFLAQCLGRKAKNKSFIAKS